MTAAVLCRAGALAFLLAAQGAVAQGPADKPESASDEVQREDVVDTIPVNVDDEEEAVPAGTGPQEERTASLFATLGLSHVASNFENLDTAINMDVSVGAALPWPFLDWLGGELDLSFTVVPGKYGGAQRCETTPPTVLDPDGTTTCEAGVFTQSQNELQMTNLALFGVIRSPGRFYGLGKYGVRAIASSIPEIQEQDRHGVAWALGGGFRFGYGRLSGIELLYSDYSEHLEYLMLGLTHGFGAAPDVRTP